MMFMVLVVRFSKADAEAAEAEFGVPLGDEREMLVQRVFRDRKSTRLNSSHGKLSRMPSSA